MIGKGERRQFLSTEFKEVFESETFHDFSTTIIQYLSVKEKNPNKLGTLTEIVLPYINVNLQNVNTSV